jgi:tRNA dimethylallyltransferase
MRSQNKTPLVAIVGPTAVGKTEIAIQVAERVGGEIVSADSRLLYRGMDIGTAKPSAADLARVPHHLINVADPDEIWSLAVFQDAAQKAIADIHSRGRLPILVGGTGQYLRAILEGWVPPKLEPRPELRRALEDWANEIGKDGLHARLARLDPEAASKIDLRNLRRTIRALEVIFSTGIKFSNSRSRMDSPYQSLQIGLSRPRADLYKRIDARIDAMLANGWLEEVKTLMSKGYSAELSAMSAIGYSQLIAYLAGKISLDEAIAQIKHDTRAFVRRQANWFKKTDPNITWFEAGDKEIVTEMVRIIRGYLGHNHGQILDFKKR